MRRTLLAVVVLAAAATVAGCGWLKAGDVSHTKPSGFVLRGYASVAGANAGVAGTACAAPDAGVAGGDPVQVADPPGTILANGMLGAGVLAVDGDAYRCNFPFEIEGVPGGHTTYSIAIGTRPAVAFPSTELREDKPAIIPIG